MSAIPFRTLLLLPLLASACATWRTVPLAPRDSVSLPAPVRVVRAREAAVELDSGRVTADSVVGLRRGTRIAISRDDVAYIEQRRVSAARTFGLAGGVLAGLWAVSLAIVAAAFFL